LIDQKINIMTPKTADKFCIAGKNWQFVPTPRKEVIMKRSLIWEWASLLAVALFCGANHPAFGQESIGGLIGEDSQVYQSQGTLFRWSSAPDVTGGPDLNAPLVTDRPDFTEASVTVGRGVAQLETGYTYFYNRDAGESVRVQSFGEPLLRYGIFADWLEFRVALFPLEEQTTSMGASNSTAGLADLYTGLKIALTPQAGLLPEMALVPQINIPTGSTAFTSDHAEPGVNWLYGWDINDEFSTGGSTQGNRRIDDTGEAYLEMAQSWTVGASLTEELGAYAEWFALIPSGADTARTEHFFNSGFTYLINDDMQFDIRAGVGLNDAAADYFLGTGFSIRVR
jgi:hypothetical protein